MNIFAALSPIKNAKSDTKWLLRQGFTTIEKLPDGFSLLVMKICPDAPNPSFKDCTIRRDCVEKEGLVVYYTNRCPFAEYHVHNSLVIAAKSKGIPLKIIKLETMEQAQSAPTPATIFSLFYNGEYLSTCIDKRLEKILKI